MVSEGSPKGKACRGGGPGWGGVSELGAAVLEVGRRKEAKW